MGLFRRRSRWRIVVPDGPVVPGADLEVMLEARRVRRPEHIRAAQVEIFSDATEDVVPDFTVGPGLPSTERGVEVVWAKSRLDDIAVPEDTTVPVTLRLPLWAPPHRIGTTEVLGTYGGAAVRVSPESYGKERQLVVGALRVHEAVLAAATELGWRYSRARLWRVPGAKAPHVELRLSFRPSDDLEVDGVTVTDVVVVPVARAPDAADLRVEIWARRTPYGRFPALTVGDLRVEGTAVEVAAVMREAVRSGLSDATLPDGSPWGEDVLGPLLRLLTD